MSSTTESLDRRKQQALDALLSHPSVEAAARASGISRATLETTAPYPVVLRARAA